MGWHCGLALQRNGNAFIREESDCQGKIGVDLQSEELLATDSEIHTHARSIWMLSKQFCHPKAQELTGVKQLAGCLGPVYEGCVQVPCMQRCSGVEFRAHVGFPLSC